MGIIINPRGTGGSGKTVLARRLLAAYGWGGEGRVEPIHRPGREPPIGYRLGHPGCGRPLLVLGQYERRCGGCDTIGLADGGLEEVFRLAELWAGAGHDVFLEGSTLSAEHERSLALARRHRLCVLRLTTPPGQAVRQLAARRHLGREAWPALARAVEGQQDRIAAACARLAGAAVVETVDVGTGLRRALELLGVPRAGLRP